MDSNMVGCHSTRYRGSMGFHLRVSHFELTKPTRSHHHLQYVLRHHGQFSMHHNRINGPGADFLQYEELKPRNECVLRTPSPILDLVSDLWECGIERSGGLGMQWMRTDVG
ncbi:hypothetical protein CPB83DRAFT_69431 [Crepidotus variabilis]|uniref:Uncharacterized protein n=1 Tax=Crepidotus variabilis TaxID=179855 RepID=A0A9P6JJF5_9AGAR|nr:hypothetical protein CPB83DRAFT_69431 [Crepidotus variabilis]